MSNSEFSESLKLYRSCIEYHDICDIVERSHYADSSKGDLEIRSHLETKFIRNALYHAKASKFMLRDDEWKEVEKLDVCYDWKSVTVERSFWGMRCKARDFRIADALYILNTCSLGAASLLHQELIGDLARETLNQVEFDRITNLGNHSFSVKSLNRSYEITLNPVSKRWEKVRSEICKNVISHVELSKIENQKELFEEYAATSKVLQEFKQARATAPPHVEIESIKLEILIRDSSFSP
jgi:hypothetical protein